MIGEILTLPIPQFHKPILLDIECFHGRQFVCLTLLMCGILKTAKHRKDNAMGNEAALSRSRGYADKKNS